MYTGAIPQGETNTTDKSFVDLGLSPPILEILHQYGFERPTPIQAAAIPIALAGNDVIGLAQTGSGKTAAFCLPLAERLQHGTGTRGLILCPTREIALQTQAFLEIFGKHRNVTSTCLIGGVKIGPQIQDLRDTPDVIVGTPGRIFDHLERRTLSLDKAEHVVLDEADHMLDLGFLPQIRRILDRVPKVRHSMMFSATMPPAIERLVQQFLNDPELIDLTPKGRTAQGIEHRLYLVQRESMKPCLMKIVEGEPGSMLIFLKRKIDAEWAFQQISGQGHAVERIHSDRSQQQRVKALSGLRSRQYKVLLATDIAARGIDIPVLEHIVNFGAPESVEDYVHRSGRTARGSAEGVVSTIATWRDKMMIREIESAINKSLPRCEMDGVEPYLERRQTIRGRQKVRRRLM